MPHTTKTRASPRILLNSSSAAAGASLGGTNCVKRNVDPSLRIGLATSPKAGPSPSSTMVRGDLLATETHTAQTSALSTAERYNMQYVVPYLAQSTTEIVKERQPEHTCLHHQPVRYLRGASHSICTCTARWLARAWQFAPMLLRTWITTARVISLSTACCRAQGGCAPCLIAARNDLPASF